MILQKGNVSVNQGQPQVVFWSIRITMVRKGPHKLQCIDLRCDLD